ncbi:MAG TPA: dienelactone hydrolase family protein [Candidatus Brocadiia bacterium]|nr:dienelactone hydrolase family protein [Candidatus Brocadiia bacterium]
MRANSLFHLIILTGVLTMNAKSESEVPLYPDKFDLLHFLDAEGRRIPVDSIEKWKIRRAHILANFQLVAGPVPGNERRIPADVRVLEETREEKYVRRKITFASEPGDRVTAWVLIPHGAGAGAPGALCLHQTVSIGKDEPVGLGGKPNLRYASELAERGYVAIAPDYPNYGEYKCDPYALGYASATMKGIWNHMRAVDVLQSLPEVAKDKIVCIGHSLGGHNSIFISVFDERIKAVVSSCGFNSFARYYGGDLTGWSHNGYMPRIAGAYEKNPQKMPFDFTELVGALAPRRFFTNSPTRDANFEVSGVRDCIAAAAPVYKLFGADGHLVAVHPDAEHDFPPEIRKQAYEFLDRAVGK